MKFTSIESTEDLRRKQLLEYRAGVTERRKRLAEINAAARAAGMTYGKYVAMLKAKEQADGKR